MNRTRILSTVSAIALTAGLGAGALAATLPNVVIDLDSDTVVFTGTSIAVGAANDQLNNNTNLTATIGPAVHIGAPPFGGASIGIGGSTTVDVSNNDDGVNPILGTAGAIGNTTTNLVSTGVATGGPLATNAAVAGSGQFNTGGTVLTSTVGGGGGTDVSVQIDANVGAASTNNTFNLNSNTLGADGDANIATNAVFGDVDLTFSSTEQGQIVGHDVGGAGGEDPAEFEASASYIAATAQYNAALGASGSTVDDTRIGLLVDADEIDASTLSVDGNEARARFAGNTSVTFVSVGSGGANTLVGSAGAANQQVNNGNATLSATVDDTVIELGDVNNVNAGGTDLGDLVNGSSAALTNNEITAAVEGNSSATSTATSGISQTGPTAAAGVQSNAASLLLGGTYVGNLQVDLAASNIQENDGVLNATIADGVLFAANLDAVTGSTLTVSNNEARSSSTANDADNTVSATGGNSFAANSGIQNLQYSSGSQTAANAAQLQVDQGDGTTETGVTITVGDADLTDGIDDGNHISSSVIGNEQDSNASISAGTISIDSLGGSDAFNNSNNTVGSHIVSADHSIVNLQVVEDDAALTASTVSAGATFDIDLHDSNGGLSAATYHVSGNSATAAATANLNNEASLSIAAGTTVATTAAVLNAQWVNDSTLTATVDTAGGRDIFEIDTNGDAVTNLNYNVDGNVASATVFGNNVPAGTNSLSVSGNTISDNGTTTPVASVARPALGPIASAIFDTGFTLVSDQIVEDMVDGPATASVSGTGAEILDFQMGGGVDVISTSDFSISGNEGRAEVTLNNVNNEVDIDASTTLNASTALVNAQSVQTRIGALSAGIDVDIAGNIEASFDVDDDFADNNIDLIGNLIRGAGTLNSASNSVSVEAGTQDIDGVIAGSTVTVGLGAAGGTNTTAVAETVLVNDQYFEALLDGGVDVDITDSDIVVDVDGGATAGDEILRTDIVVGDPDLDDDVDEGNRIEAVSRGNVGANGIDLAVGTFDLAGADVGATSRRGPVASLVSNQHSGAESTTGFSASVTDADITATVTLTDSVTNSDILVQGNTISAFARVNVADNGHLDADGNQVNGLEVSGNSFLHADTVVGNAPTASYVFGGNDLSFSNTAFAVANRQISNGNVTTNVTGAEFGVFANVTNAVTNANLSTNNNTAQAQSRGNDATNMASVDFGTNEASAFVGNFQKSAPTSALGVPGFTYSATVDADFSTDADDGTDTSITGMALTVDNNTVLAAASGDRATNRLSAGGTNITGSMPETVLPIVDASLAATPNIGGTDYAIINHQGDTTGESDVALVATVSPIATVTTLEVLAQDVVSGAISISGNTVRADTILEEATNVLAIDASANVGAAGDSLSAAILSRQVVDDDSSATSTIGALQIGSVGTIDDISNAGAVAINIDGNFVEAESHLGMAINTLTVDAGANIFGNDEAALVPVIGTAADTLDADFNVLNVQLTDGGGGSTSTAQITVLQATGLQIGANVNSAADGDSLSVDNNVVLADAVGFVASNTLALTAGANDVTAAAQIGNHQIHDASIVVTARIDLAGQATDGAGLDLVAGADSTAVSVSGNIFAGLAVSNDATNMLSASAGATLPDSAGAGTSLTGTGIAVTAADMAILNRQISTDGSTIATVQDFGIGANVAGGLTTASIGVNNNVVVAGAVGNRSVNGLTLNAGVSAQMPASVVANQQINDGQTITATISNVSIGAGGVTGSTGSNVSVSGNAVGATAVGNSSFSSIGQ